MNPTRIGIAGLGNIGSSHVKRFQDNLIPDAVLTAVCDANPAALARYPALKGWTSSADLIRSGEIDALIVATPHSLHAEQGIDALQNGLHVLCEKPLAVAKADCLRLLAAHTNPKQVFGVMFDTRTEPRYRQLREFIQSGQLGRIRRINWIMTEWFRSNAYYQSSPWRATWAGEGGGLLVNQLPHDLDLFQWIFGLPRKVRAFCPLGKSHPIEVEDEVNALLEYADGCTAVLVASTGEAPGTDRREVVGENGRVIVHRDRLEFTRNRVPADEFCRTTKELWAKPESEEVVLPVVGTAARHTEVIQKFVQAIRHGSPLVAEAAEALGSIELANAIILASAQDRTVELPVDPAEFTAFLAEKCATSSYRAGGPAASAPPADLGKSFSR